MRACKDQYAVTRPPRASAGNGAEPLAGFTSSSGRDFFRQFRPLATMNNRHPSIGHAAVAWLCRLPCMCLGFEFLPHRLSNLSTMWRGKFDPSMIWFLRPGRHDARASAVDNWKRGSFSTPGSASRSQLASLTGGPYVGARNSPRSQPAVSRDFIGSTSSTTR